jgi:twitching motility protein PilT
MLLDDLLKKIVELDGSDLHITVGTPPRVRKGGSLVEIGSDKLNPEMVKSMIESKMSKDQLRRYNNGQEIDYSIGIPGLSRFRVNVFSQRGNIAAAYRRLPIDPPELDTLGLPPSVINLANKRKGLILITGATGSGKSTTMAALVNQITQELEGHVLTIEDPIEYLFPHRKSQVNQREVGVDTDSFASGLKSALRQDPDVVVVGELRDPESMGAALSIAETGHLVLATMHTNTAAGAITRMVDAFPADKKEVIRMNMSMSLLSVVAQQLVPTKDGSRILACEVMIATQAIRAVIRENNIHQLDNYIKSGGKDGMLLMDDSLIELYQKGLISKENLLRHAINMTQVEQNMGTVRNQHNF